MTSCGAAHEGFEHRSACTECSDSWHNKCVNSTQYRRLATAWILRFVVKP